MTYQEVNDRLTRVQTALQSLQDGSYANTTSINVPQMTSQLQEAEAKLKEQLLVLSEAEKTAFINGQPTEYTDEKELQKFKDNQDVKSIKTAAGKKLKEQQGPQFNLDETKAIAREIGKAVAQGLKSMGDELATMKVKNIEEGSFDIHVQYKKDTSTDDFSFYISGDDLHLQDFSFDKVIGGVGVKPSGEPIVHVDVIANELVKHWKSQMREGMSDDEFQQAQQNQRLEDHPEKDMIKKIQALIAKEKKIKEGEDINEAPEGMYYIKIPKDAASQNKAQVIFNDLYGVKYELNDDPDGVIMYFKKEDFDAGIMDDLEGDGVQILDTNVPMNEVDVKEQDGGDLDVGHQDDEPNMLKKDLYDIATYAAKLYKQLDNYDKHDGEVDFPHWWQKKVTLAREYISSAQHYLEAEEKQPALDQLALERVVRDNESPSLKAKIAAEDFMSQYRKAFRLVSNNFGKEVEAEFKSIIKAKFAQLQEDSLDEIGIFNDPVGYEKSKPEKRTYTKKYVSKGIYDIFKNGKKVKTVKGGEGDANAWMNNALRGQKNEAVGGQSISDLKPGDKFEFNGKTYTLVKHIEGSVAKVILPSGDTSVVSFGGKINIAKKAGIGPDYFGQGKGHHIDEAAYDSATKNELAQYIINLNNELKAAKSRGMDKEAEQLQKDIEEVKAALARKKEVNEEKATCCGKCGRVHVKGTKCKTPYLKGKDHCRYN